MRENNVFHEYPEPIRDLDMDSTIEELVSKLLKRISYAENFGPHGLAFSYGGGKVIRFVISEVELIDVLGGGITTKETDLWDGKHEGGKND